jgi:negative regulator of flagellin synthesis FlgM
VTITGSARSLAALERALADTPEANAARVAELRASIETGKYVVDPHRIAERLVDLAHELASISGRAR